MPQIAWVGWLSLLIGVLLLFFNIRSRGEMDTKFGRFRGPVWFILMAFGIVILLIDSIST